MARFDDRALWLGWGECPGMQGEANAMEHDHPVEFLEWHGMGMLELGSGIPRNGKYYLGAKMRGGKCFVF